jgi:hypothetical protein
MNNPEERDLFLVALKAVLPDIAVRIDRGEATSAHFHASMIPLFHLGLRLQLTDCCRLLET